MNIHEHQAKEILRSFGVPVPSGYPVFALDELKVQAEKINTQKVVLKAQIHAGGRGKAGGVKVVDSFSELESEAKQMFGKVLVTPQTGEKGRKVQRLYLESGVDIDREFYLSCLVDRASSKIAFISSAEGGMDIEEVAKQTPDKIITTKVDLTDSVDESDVLKILAPFKLSKTALEEGKKVIQGIYRVLVENDASLIEINPLVVTKDEKVICLDAKISLDDNALFRHPNLLELRDFNEEEPTEIEASEHNLAYVKLDGEIGCMVNGAGLAMATMDTIQLYGAEPANFLDVGGGATKEKVKAAFKIILSDKNVKGVLVNIFGGIMKCDVIAEGVIAAAKEIELKVPLVVRLAGTNFEKGKEILNNSGLEIIAADNLNEAAEKIVKAIQ